MFKSKACLADDVVMDTARTRRALMRLVGAAVVVLGVFLTATAVRRADQVVATGREVLLGGEIVDVFTARDLRIEGHARLSGTAVALGDLDVPSGSLRVDRDAASVFAVGGGVAVGESASVVFPAVGALKYGTIRSGAVGDGDTVLRDPDAVARYAAMVSSLQSSSVCFARAASTGIVRRSASGISFVGDGASGLQVFNVDRDLVGPITISRVPREASVLINLTGSAVEIAPIGADWRAIAPNTLVNIADALTVDVDAQSNLRMNMLVGSSAGVVRISGTRITGAIMSMSTIELGHVQVMGGPVLAPMLPDCAPTFEPALDEITQPAWNPPTATDATDSSISTSTSTSTTTTTVLDGRSAPGDRPVPGAAFALGGAATASHWWLGLPVSSIGAVLLGWSWIERRYREQRSDRRQRRSVSR